MMMKIIVVVIVGGVKTGTICLKITYCSFFMFHILVFKDVKDIHVILNKQCTGLLKKKTQTNPLKNIVQIFIN